MKQSIAPTGLIIRIRPLGDQRADIFDVVGVYRGRKKMVPQFDKCRIKPQSNGTLDYLLAG